MSTAPPSPSLGTIAEGTARLEGEDGLEWAAVSPALVRGRLMTLGICLAPLAAAGAVLGRWAHPSGWALVAVAAVIGLWGLWLVPRQVRAISYVELADELLIRRGRVLRSLVAIPYGRMQYVDLESGPLARRLGYAKLEIHTASPESSGHVPGLPTALAEDLRVRLAARGESQRAGL